MPGVYISYPFCSRKCTYCNFASGPQPAELEREYVEALLDEIAAYAWRWRPETVYLGGGSPNRMTPEALRRLLDGVPGRPWIEATIEAAPGEIGRERARLWAASGITRASLGVQSFVPGEIIPTGRKYAPETVAADIDELRRAGITRINVDLIAGLPGQTTASWSVSLDWIEKLGVDHVSVYMLEVDSRSRLGRELLAGGTRYHAREVPSEDVIAELYEQAVERLAAAGIRRYEISNFARPGYESRHNLKYWRLEPYAGFGAGAHSFDGRLRYWNAETAQDYLDRWRRRLPATVGQTPANRAEERFFLGLRLTGGITLKPEEWERYRTTIARFLEEGLLERAGDRLRLTARGLLLSNEVFQEFLTT